MNPTFIKKSASTALAVMMAAALCLAADTVLAWGDAPAQLDAPASLVGEVSLVLGKAYIHKPGAAREAIKVGTAISVNDTIETATNGHVHIRFIDQALVSVRPSSTLEIIRYDYTPEAPADSVVKLNLVEGVTRAISGQAAKQARQNFRMNTPIAAIGVRGTDFVVSANQQSVRALVNEGAIIVAPYSSLCSAAAQGPCSQNALELAGGASQIIQITANTLNPVLLPVSTSEVPEAMVAQTAAPAAAAGKTEHEENGGGDLYADSVSSRVVNRTIASTKGDIAVPPAFSEFTPDVAVASQELTNSQMVWGRYSKADSLNERITLLNDIDNVASVDGREGTVGNAAYGLFRTENGSHMVQPGLGVLAFELNKAQAIYKIEGRSELMDVFGGRLDIDFNQNQFSTNLSMGHAATGNVQLNASGSIGDYGYFNSREATQQLGGAISLDGTEAGYFFEKTLEAGSIEGLTLWGRQP